MKYLVRYSSAAQKQLDRLEWRYYLVVYERILTLKDNPRPIGTIKLTGRNLHRMRIGNYRAVYSIDENQRIIEVVRIMRRREDTYKGL